MIAIDIQNLTKRYSPIRGVFNLSLTLDEGEIFGLLGANGAGKTTAMKMLCGLVRPDSGQASICGHNIQEDPAAALRKMGCILETAELYPYLSAWGNLEQVARFYPELPPERLQEVLELVGMGRYAQEKARSFSLGMKQRVGLAMALVHKPRVLVLDEPMNGLDVEGMVLVRSLLQRLATEERVTILLSSHLIHDVELTCTRVGIIQQGELRHTATTADIKREHPSLESYYLKEVSHIDQSESRIL